MNSSVLSAAEVWAKIYEMARESKERYDTFRLLELEEFSARFDKAIVHMASTEARTT